MITYDTNNAIEHFKEELSFEHILVAIRKLQEQVEKLDKERVYGASQPNNI